MTNFHSGEEVEIKGFGRWTGLSLLGEIIRYIGNEYYVVEIYAAPDPDETDEYLYKPLDESYYLQKQDQYHIVHRQFLREADGREVGVNYKIGDVVDWEESYISVKGTIIGKELNKDAENNDPDTLYHYTIKLEESNEVIDADYYDIRQHVPWN